jgi:hypothetical protein
MFAVASSLRGLIPRTLLQIIFLTATMAAALGGKRLTLAIEASSPDLNPGEDSLLSSAPRTESLGFAYLRNRYDRIVIRLPRGDIDLLVK